MRKVGSIMSSFVTKGSAVSLESVRTGLTPSHISKMNRLNGRLWKDSQGTPGGPFLLGDTDGEVDQGNSNAGSGPDTQDT